MSIRPFRLAAELEQGEDALRQRQQEKERILLSAGVVFPSEGGWGQRRGVAMTADDFCEIPPPYLDLPVGPGGSTSGSTGRLG